MIEAALFDMDGLLLDSENVYAEGLRAATGQLSYAFTHEVLMETIGDSQAAIGVFSAPAVGRSR